MNQEVFKRYEKKYKLSLEQYQELMSRIITRLQPDQYGKHSICNIYFDSKDYSLIRRSLEKPAYKEKIRLRSYGQPGPEDQVFLELKKKFDGVVYKRRIPMKLSEAKRYLCHGIRPGQHSQILDEIDYAIKFYQAHPAVYLAYERIAFSGKEDSEFRVTFDMNIRARENSLELDKGSFGAPLLQKGELLMEVKIPGAMPIWMSRVLAELAIYPISYSKYGTYYQEYIAGKMAEQGGQICA